MHHTKTVISGILTGWLAFTSSAVFAAQGDGNIATEPLFLAPPEPPNIMLLLDSTGSMSRTLSGGSVSSDPLKKLINPSRMDVLKNVFLGRTLPTRLRFRADDGDRFNASLNCAQRRCRRARNNRCQSFRSSSVLNTSQQALCRTIVAEGNTTGLFDDNVFDNSRVGLAEFFSSSCGSTTCRPFVRFLVNINDIRTNLNSLKQELEGIQPGGATPLAVALQTMGLYFSQAASEGLTLHPDTDQETTKSRITIFKNSALSFSSSPAPISSTHFCATNHAVLLTDGEPFKDNPFSSGSGLRNYDGDASFCESGNSNNTSAICGSTGLNKDNLDDVALALKEIDMRPDVEGLNNVITHVVGFGTDVLELSILRDAVEHSGGELKTATSAAQLKTAFEVIAARAIQSDATASAATFNTATLTSGSIAFRAQFTSGIWSGEVSAHIIDDVTGEVDLNCVTTNPTVCWQASKLLAANNARKIFTLSNQNTGISFTSNNLGDFNQTLQDDLNTNNQASDLISYLRGNRSLEGTRFRARGGVLGDIISSEAVFHNGVLYVGANDGMLHAFSAVSGEELFAYIPGGVAATGSEVGLHYLADKNYIHRPYVDLTPIITRVGNKDVLIGGYGGGAKGLFALDISNPSAFNGSDVLWELTAQDVANLAGGDHLGFLLHAPVVADINDSQRIIFGNGYQSASGLAKLFHISASGPGGDNLWNNASELTVLDAGTLASNGLGGVNVELAFDENGSLTRNVDVVYAGSLQGNLWSFLGGSAPRLVFQAGNDQPITAPPAAKLHQVVDGTSQYLVFFGTGAFFAEGDNENSDIQSYYSIIDTRSGLLSSTNLRRVNIREVETASKVTRLTSQADAQPDDVFSGWFIDLPTAFERSVLVSTLFDSNDINVVIFATTIPEAAKDDNGNLIPCASGGSGFVMVLDQLTGISPDTAVFDLNGDLVVDDDDLVGSEVPSGFKVSDLPTSPRILKKDSSDGSDSNSNSDSDGSDGGTNNLNVDNSELFINTSSGVDETLLQTRRKPTVGGDATLQRDSWREIR